MIIINGRKIRDEILEDLKKQISALPFRPIFCDILIGDDPASLQYVGMKNKTAEKIGIEVYPAKFHETITTEELLKEIRKINKIERMSGLIAQLPLPAHIDKDAILGAIDPMIDVDCIGQENSGFFYGGKPRFVFPTALAVMHIIDFLYIDLSKMNIAIIGKGDLVGRPVRQILLERGFDSKVIDRSTENVAELLQDADLIISAAGRADIVKGGMVKEGAIVIDAGTSEFYGSIVGDVEFDSVSKVASVISPVPGGVGPVTVAMLFKNVVEAAKTRSHSN